MKIDKYLEELKKDILNDVKKELEVEAEKMLKPLQDEVAVLKIEHNKKSEILSKQQKIIKDSYEAHMKKSREEKKMRILSDHIWHETINLFFKEHGKEWLKKMISNIPNEKGVVRFSADTPNEILNEIKKKNSNIETEKDSSISTGFIFESEATVIDCTKDAFLKSSFPLLKHELLDQLKSVNN